METITQAGEAADALRINQIYQVQSREAYWISGGSASPGSSSTEIQVDIEAGEARFSGSKTTWAATTVALDAASADPRVDVVYVQSDGSFGVVTGTPHTYRPNQDEDGNAMTPAPFEHWEPSPDDGGNVLGHPICCVLVEPGMADSTDLTTSHIQDRRMTTSSESQSGQWNTLSFPVTEIAAGDYAELVDVPNGKTAYLVGIAAREADLGTAGVEMKVLNGAEDTTYYSFDANAEGGAIYGSLDSPLATATDPNLRVHLINNTGAKTTLSGKATFVYA